MIGADLTVQSVISRKGLQQARLLFAEFPSSQQLAPFPFKAIQHRNTFVFVSLHSTWSRQRRQDPLRFIQHPYGLLGVDDLPLPCPATLVLKSCKQCPAASMVRGQCWNVIIKASQPGRHDIHFESSILWNNKQGTSRPPSMSWRAWLVAFKAWLAPQSTKALLTPYTIYFMLVVAKKTWSGTRTRCPLKCEFWGEVAIDGLLCKTWYTIFLNFCGADDAPSLSGCLFIVQAKNGSTW